MSLLHNKKFLNNLGKWICMYVGVIILFATIVTYSKYISKFEGTSDNNKTAKFDLTLSCTNNNGEACDTNTSYDISENSEFTYSFSVNDSNMDVKSTLKLFLFVDNSFKVTSPLFEKGESSDNTSKTMYSLKQPIDLPSSEDLNFSVNVKYIMDKKDELSKDKNNPTKKEVVVVGYAVEQIKTEGGNGNV